MYAPFGAGVLIGPRRILAARDQSLLGSGAAPVLDLEDMTRITPRSGPCGTTCRQGLGA